MGEIILFKTKDECCGCGACANVCPKQAISMREDNYGFIYPKIDYSLCISCKLCKKVCNYQNIEPKNTPIKVFAASSRNDDLLLNSASGGIFSSIAEEFLKNNNFVCGSELKFIDGHPKVNHIIINSLKDLYRLQGSKYVQSEIGSTYYNIKKLLDKGEKVLFSGTPCQVAGLYGFLRKSYENLYTIDIICHGVPSNNLFDSYIQYKNIKNSGNVIEYKFRDKRKGWGMNFSYTLIKKKSKKQHYHPARIDSYYSLFLDGATYRENCYTCPYAKSKRTGDITLGDYWGIEEVHPELKKSKVFNEKNGISCLLVNTEKGARLLNFINKKIITYPSNIENVKVHNKQLYIPYNKPNVRKEFLSIYKKDNDYYFVEKWFKKKYRMKIISHYIYNKIPRKIRLTIKRCINNKRK